MAMFIDDQQTRWEGEEGMFNDKSISKEQQ